MLGPVSFNSCRLLINLYAKVYNFMIGGLCKTTLASVGNVSPDEGISESRNVTEQPEQRVRRG